MRKRPYSNAKNALLEGLPFETIRNITGLDMEQITALSATM